MSRQLNRRAAIGIALSMAGSLAFAELARPRRRLSELHEKIDLERQVPRQFAGWTIDDSMIPIAPDPVVQEKLNSLYSQVMARSYHDGQGRLLMLSIAYGSDQASEATSVHRPEFCYSAQGFKVNPAGRVLVDVAPGEPLMTQRLIASGPRFEPLSYWVTLDEKATLPGLGRKLAQISYGLHGDIPDGMLVRVSTVGLGEKESFEVQAQFLRDLYAVMDPGIRPRYFGA